MLPAPPRPILQQWLHHQSVTPVLHELLQLFGCKQEKLVRIDPLLSRSTDGAQQAPDLPFQEADLLRLVFQLAIEPQSEADSVPPRIFAATPNLQPLWN